MWETEDRSYNLAYAGTAQSVGPLMDSFAELPALARYFVITTWLEVILYGEYKTWSHIYFKLICNVDRHKARPLLLLVSYR